MSDANDTDPSSDCAELAQSKGSTIELDRVQELAWALIDERISDSEKAWLDETLCCSEEARRTYLRCIQLHTDLTAHFAAPAATAEAKPVTNSPVLGFLGEGLGPLVNPPQDAAVQ